jgi:hypothetical protein
MTKKGVAMKNGIRILSLSICLAFGTGPAFAAQSSSDTMSKAEARQMHEDFSPTAQYNLSKREAYAAYDEALKACKGMRGTDRRSCNKDAQSQLKNDLAYAKQELTEGSSGNRSSSDSGIRMRVEPINK